MLLEVSYAVLAEGFSRGDYPTAKQPRYRRYGWTMVEAALQSFGECSDYVVGSAVVPA
jgi:hypothetical protein